jgi:L-lactate utilization protein LutB
MINTNQIYDLVKQHRISEIVVRKGIVSDELREKLNQSGIEVEILE